MLLSILSALLLPLSASALEVKLNSTDESVSSNTDGSAIIQGCGGFAYTCSGATGFWAQENGDVRFVAILCQDGFGNTKSSAINLNNCLENRNGKLVPGRE
jgi:hypothetical protein